MASVVSAKSVVLFLTADYADGADISNGVAQFGQGGLAHQGLMKRQHHATCGFFYGFILNKLRMLMVPAWAREIFALP